MQSWYGRPESRAAGADTTLVKRSDTVDDTRLLFAPLKVQGKTLRNRIVMPPMVVNRELTSQEGWDWYGRHADGGVGLVIVEATDIIRFASELTAENLRPLAAAIHTGGALAAIQLFPGRRAEQIVPADLARRDTDRLLELYGKGAQACADAGFDGIEPPGAHG